MRDLGTLTIKHFSQPIKLIFLVSFNTSLSTGRFHSSSDTGVILTFILIAILKPLLTMLEVLEIEEYHLGIFPSFSWAMFGHVTPIVSENI